jgi:hypothetical protein
MADTLTHVWGHGGQVVKDMDMDVPDRGWRAGHLLPLHSSERVWWR